MFTCDGEKILEGPSDYAGTIFPWIMVMGEEVIIEGRHYWWGMVRHAKDAQRNYNVSKTAIAETIAQAPKAKYWATVEQAKGHTANWQEADRKNFPYQLYTPDPMASTRTPPAERRGISGRRFGWSRPECDRGEGQFGDSAITRPARGASAPRTS